MSYNPDADLYEAAEEQADDDQYSSNLASSVEDVDATADSYGDADAGESVSESLNDPSYDWGSSGGGSFGSFGPAADSDDEPSYDPSVGISVTDEEADGDYGGVTEWEPPDGLADVQITGESYGDFDVSGDFGSYEPEPMPDPWEPPEGLDDVEVTADSYDDLDDADHDGATSDTAETTTNETIETADEQEDSTMSEWTPPEGWDTSTAEDYGDFDAGGMEGVDGEVTYTIDQYGEAYIGEDEDGNEQLMAPEGFELDSDQEEALASLLSARNEETEGDISIPDGLVTQSALNDAIASYQQQLAALASQVQGDNSGGVGRIGAAVLGLVAFVVGMQLLGGQS